jgi:hypothetical protein
MSSWPDSISKCVIDSMRVRMCATCKREQKMEFDYLFIALR